MLLKRKLHGCIRSWTIWFNSLAMTALPALDYARENVSALHGVISEHLYMLLLSAVVAGNILLRFKTDRALEDK